MNRGCVECCSDGKGGKSECRRVDLTYDGIPAVVLMTGGQRFMSTRKVLWCFKVGAE